MKIMILNVILLLFSSQIIGQVANGRVVNLRNGESLEYASVGIVNEPIGTITDEHGFFELETRGQSIDKIVRFSMIGFKSKSLSIGELLNNKSTIKLEEEIYEIPQVIIRPVGVTKIIGTKGYSRFAGTCGWGGTQIGQGSEIGLRLELGDNLVKIKKLHIRLYMQSFDSTLLRLHIRDILDDVPNKQLLTKNIFLNVNKESGWVEFDLDEYDLFLSGDIVLSLEWVNVFGIDKKRLLRVTDEKILSANVLFNMKQRTGNLYFKWGSDALWSHRPKVSPSFYVTVEE